MRCNYSFVWSNFSDTIDIWTCVSNYITDYVDVIIHPFPELILVQFILFSKGVHVKPAATSASKCKQTVTTHVTLFHLQQEFPGSLTHASSCATTRPRFAAVVIQFKPSFSVPRELGSKMNGKTLDLQDKIDECAMNGVSVAMVLCFDVSCINRYFCLVLTSLFRNTGTPNYQNPPTEITHTYTMESIGNEKPCVFPRHSEKVTRNSLSNVRGGGGGGLPIEAQELSKDFNRTSNKIFTGFT